MRVQKENVPIMELFRKSVDASREANAKVVVWEKDWPILITPNLAFFLALRIEENSNLFGMHHFFCIAPQALSTITMRKCVLKV